MKQPSFHPDTFFMVHDFLFQDIFSNIENVWEVLPKLSSYIHTSLDKNELKANFGNDIKVFIGEGTIIEEDVKITGPAIIGKNCRIRHGALIRENCILGDNVTIGHAVEIKNSLVLNGATVAHLNYVGDSIIGNNVNISGGAMIANYRLDKQTVKVKNGEGKLIDTNLRKFGAVIGDNSMIGVNAVINPGTILGKNTLVHPLVSVKGVHADNEIIK